MSTRYEPVDLLTLDDLRIAADPSYGEEHATEYTDNVLAPIISEVSGQIAADICQHTLRKERTETHAIRGSERTITLRAANVDPDSIEVEIDGDFLDESDFVLHEETGWIQLHKPLTGRRFDIFKASVTYTGGLGADTEALKLAHPRLHAAAVMQAKYRLERRDNIGGPISVPQGMTATASGQYRTLRHVAAVLDTYRRFEG